MDGFSYFVLYQCPYLTLPFYGVALGFRFWVWFRFYNPALKLLPASPSVYRVWARQYRPTIDIFPGRKRTRRSEALNAVKGFLFFWGLFKRDKALWIGSWTFHVGLGLVVLAHIRLVLDLPESVQSVFRMSADLGGKLVLASGVYLLIRRVVVARVREITTFRDYLAELLLLAVVVSGYAASGQVHPAQVRAYVAGVFTFSDALPVANPVFVWHMLCVHLLLVVMPFSHLLHFGGIFLSWRFLGTSDTLAGAYPEFKIKNDR